MKKNVSIYDIAEYLQVSPATVSYVINGVNKVSEKTKQRILDAIDELGYVPDHNARSLSTGKSHLIGLFLPLDDASIAFLQNPFYVEFLGGLELGIANQDYDIVIGSQRNSANFKDWAISRRLDGIVMLGKYPKNVYDDIKKLNIPVVLTDIYEEYSSEFYNVRINDEKGMYMATEYLIKNGHKNIGFIGYNTYSLVDMTRYNGYKKALIDNNIDINYSYIYPCLATFEDGYKFADKLLENKDITAIVCAADIIAVSIIKRYSELNKKIPEELSIIGFDDIQVANYIHPGLTTIKQDITEKGRKTAELIINSLKNNISKNIIVNLEPTLVERQSVKKI
ncbi:MAG: LacI family DNA-binding transcriptional regulator [Bacilli bacterium]|nr:LacI family DNA-binding transcriptional regulator [Bacilli bacterium]